MGAELPSPRVNKPGILLSHSPLAKERDTDRGGAPLPTCQQASNMTVTQFPCCRTKIWGGGGDRGLGMLYFVLIRNKLRQKKLLMAFISSV
jgi:hypothetical protein